MPGPRLTLEEFLPLMLSITGAVAVAPFALIRLAGGEWVMGAIDVFIVAALLGNAWVVYKYRAVREASIFMALLCLVGVITTIYAKGAGQVLWAYPAMMAVFYLLKPREAIAVAAVCIAVLIPVLVGALPTKQLAMVFVTLWVTLAFAYAFAVLSAGQKRQLESLSRIDPLTGAGNRRALAEHMRIIISRSKAEATPMSLVMLDLDHFKRINDEYGHAAGDELLTEVTNIIAANIRTTDRVYRIGGEEFVVMAESSGLDLACRLGETLRRRIAAMKDVPGGGVTVSLGVAELGANESGDDWFRRADNALYEAKRSGRNQLCRASTLAEA